jgi:hypothetical protein
MVPAKTTSYSGTKICLTDVRYSGEHLRQHRQQCQEHHDDQGTVNFTLQMIGYNFHGVVGISILNDSKVGRECVCDQYLMAGILGVRVFMLF